MTPLQSRVLRNVLEVEAYGRGVALQILEVLTASLPELQSKLKRLGDSAIYSRVMNLSIQKEIADLLATVDSRVYGILTGARRTVIKAEYAAISKALIKELREGGLTELEIPTQIPRATLAEIAYQPVGGHALEKWTKDLAASQQAALKAELMKSVTQSETVEQAGKRLREAFGMSRNSADNLARTSVLDASQRAQERVYEDNDDVITGFQYLATLDQATCPICGPDDLEKADTITELPAVPRHPRCRCRVIALTRFSEPIARPAVTSYSERTVQHRDGSTSTKQTVGDIKFTKQRYQEFFDSQPAEWKRSVLGDTKYELYRDGNLSLDDLRSASGTRILNNKELEAALN